MIQRVACSERKKFWKHLVGKGKGSTFAIPNDEELKRRGRGMKRVEKGSKSWGRRIDL